MSRKFEIGDVVNLLAGGPTMTVESYDDTTVHTIWFTYDARSETWNGPHRAFFPEAALDARTSGFAVTPRHTRPRVL